MSDPENQTPEADDKSLEDSRQFWIKNALKAALSTVAVGVLLALISQAITLPYFVLSPGSTIPLGSQVEVPEGKGYESKGDILLTTVAVVQAHPFDILWAWLTPHTKIEKQKAVIGDSTPKQYFEDNSLLMDDSKMVATYVAMQRAGFEVSIAGDGAAIDAVSENSPSSGKLQPGDVVVSIDGKKVSVTTDLVNIVRATPQGAKINLEVQDSSGNKRNVELTTAAHPQDANTSYIGVSLKTKNPHLVAPFEIDVKTNNIGGPSAGLAFTLAAIDAITPGDLTGGKQVVATGTISTDGTVGPVGGVEFKTETVNDSKAKLFLVPQDELEEAKKKADKDVSVVAVNTLDDALNALRDNGGDLSGLPNK